MNDRVYQILYCSRNNIRGTAEQVDAEIAGILVSSRRNNQASGVTGALFHNDVLFAQVLEGRFSDVQRIFERLQMDARHSDLVVLQSGYVESRAFAGWAMAYSGPVSDLPVSLDTQPGAPFSPSESSVAGQKVVDFLQGIVHMKHGAVLPTRRPTVPVLSPAQPVPAQPLVEA